MKLRKRWLAPAVVLALVVAGVVVVGDAGGPAAADPPALEGSSAPVVPARPAPSAAVPSLEGPIAGPNEASFANYPLSQVGYSESEYFFSGDAHAYSSSSPLTADGKWTVHPGDQAPYRSRMVVLQPTKRSKFSGKVVVEWFNVTSGFDAGVDWSYGHDEMIRSGDVYVGISAQAVGVNELVASDPGRYGSLVHPGDSFSYDIFSQGGMVVRALASKILPGLHPQVVVADGESQSAGRLTTYVDAVAPAVSVFDGYLIHSRGGGGAPLSQAPQAAIDPPAAVFTRDDLTVPVLTFESETDVLGISGFYPARQGDSRLFRLWEVAGTAHVDSYVSLYAGDDNTSWASDLTQFAAMSSPPKGFSVMLPSGPLDLSCSGNLNTGEHHYVYQSALNALFTWAQFGVAPPKMPRLQVDTSGSQPTYRVDRNGNVLGGVRTPAVDVPVATLSGLAPQGAPGFCIFFGQTHPLTASQLSTLYPTHQDFVRKWQRAVARSTASGALLPADGTKLAQIVAGF